MRLRELYTTLILEGVADVVKRLKTTYPDQVQYIDEHANWIRKTFPKGAEWYMLIIADHMSGDQTRLQKRLGDYPIAEFNQIQSKLAHFSTLDYQPIKDYAFNAKPVSEVLKELDALEERWKTLPSRPVTAQRGDYVIKDYGNGFQWWFVNRGFCEEEGRSGKHCGNVVGKEQRNQRILSLRKNMSVVLTFILLPDGFLGEMKANGNQKPSHSLHNPYIMDLLLSDMVKGIKGAGWGPEFNFSIFDLDDNNLNIILQQRPTFIENQIQATPREILRAPDAIKLNPTYQQLAMDYDSDLDNFFVNGKVDNSLDAWERAIVDNPSYIIYAPIELKNYKQRVIDTLIKKPKLFLESPRHIIKDQEIVIAVVSEEPDAIRYIPPAGLNPAIYEMAVTKNGNYLYNIPEEQRTPKLCKIAVSQSAGALINVPEHLKTNELYTIALHNKYPLNLLPAEFHTPKNYKISIGNGGMSLRYVPEHLITPELCKLAVANSSWALRYVPEHLITPELCNYAVEHRPRSVGEVPPKFITPALCKLAVEKDGKAFDDVPEHLRTPELYHAAIKSHGTLLGLLQPNERTPELCKLAVKNDGDALSLVPEHLKTPELCKDAVTQRGHAIRDVPEHLKTPELCKLAIFNKESPGSLSEVPPELRTPELCNHAVRHLSSFELRQVPEHLKTPEMCNYAVRDYSRTLEFVPEDLRTIKLCRHAVVKNAEAMQFIPDAIGMNDPETYFKLLHLGLDRYTPDNGDNDGASLYALEILQSTRYRDFLPLEQQRILEKIASIHDNNRAAQEDDFDNEDE